MLRVLVLRVFFFCSVFLHLSQRRVHKSKMRTKRWEGLYRFLAFFWPEYRIEFMGFEYFRMRILNKISQKVTNARGLWVEKNKQFGEKN